MKTTKSDLLCLLFLFISFCTLLCSALFLLLCGLDLMAIVAGYLDDFPILITLGKNKGWVLGFALLLLTINFFITYRKKKEGLISEFVLDRNKLACNIASRWSKVILWISFTLFLIGFFVSYLLVPLIKLYGF